MASELEIVINKVSEDSWREFLERTPGAMIYHTPEWKRVLEKSFGYKPYYIFVVDDTGQIRGFLPLMLIRSKLFGNRLSSLPLSHRCGYIGNPTFLREAFNSAVKLYNEKLGNGALEIRESSEGYFKEACNFSTYILELSNDLDEVWKKLDKGSVRWAIKKAAKLGVNVEISNNSKEDIKLFYELNCETKKRKGVPCHPLRFFKSLFRYASQYSQLYLAKINDDTIGGGVMLLFRDTVVYGYGAAKDSMLRYHPYHAFLWKAIEDSINSGFRYFDFGRAHRQNTGLIQFKKRWGTKEIPLIYSYYPSIPKAGNLRNNRTLISIVRYLPSPAYKFGSNWIFGKVV